MIAFLTDFVKKTCWGSIEKKDMAEKQTRQDAQEILKKVGRDQLERLSQKGLSIQVTVA